MQMGVLGRWISLSVFALVAMGEAFAIGMESRLPPVDEGPRDPTFVAFRQQLLNVVEARDAAALSGLLYSKIENGKKAKKGIDAFRKHWQPENKDSELWPVLEGILKLGGGFVRSSRGVQFCAPYLFSDFPAELDIYGHAVVTGDAVELKRQPRRNGQKVRTLSYHILKVEDWRSIRDRNNESLAWIKVRTLDGSEGYVRKDRIRSPSDYHACFLAMSPGWRMISLLATD